MPSLAPEPCSRPAVHVPLPLHRPQSSRPDELYVLHLVTWHARARAPQDEEEDEEDEGEDGVEWVMWRAESAEGSDQQPAASTTAAQPGATMASEAMVEDAVAAPVPKPAAPAGREPQGKGQGQGAGQTGPVLVGLPQGGRAGALKGKPRVLGPPGRQPPPGAGPALPGRGEVGGQ